MLLQELKELHSKELEDFKKNKIKIAEKDIQKRVVEELEKKEILFHPSMSGLYVRNFRIVAVMKQQGIRRGYPDMMIFKDGKVLFLELKTLKGVLSLDQKTIHDKLKREGFQVVTSYGLYDALIKITDFIGE